MQTKLYVGNKEFTSHNLAHAYAKGEANVNNTAVEIRQRDDTDGLPYTLETVQPDPLGA